jgi:very-short-patch-repair endonuclease
VHLSRELSEGAAILDAMSSAPVPRMRRLAGIATTAELYAAGESSRQIGARVASGELVRIGRGYLATADFVRQMQPLGFGEHFLRAYAVVGALGPGAVASHRTAAHIHGLDLLAEPGATVTVTRAPGRGSRSAKPGVHLHVARLPPDHICERFCLPITTAARTVLDLARTAPFREALVVADNALHQHLTSKQELAAVLAECPRTRGCRQAAEVVEFADGLAESPLESIARVVFRDGNLPAPSLQVRIGDSEFTGRVDFLWERYRTVVEVDGLMKYTDPYRARAQLRRDQKLRDAGYEVVHFDWHDITSRPEAVVAAIRAAFRAGSQRRSPGPVA